MTERTPDTLPTMPYSEDTRTCAKACMAVLPPNDAMYLWLQIYLGHTAALQARVDALERESDGLVDAYNAKSQRCAELEAALANKEKTA